MFDHILSDRITLYAPIFQYVSAELQKHHIYHYDSARILDACDIVSGKYIAALLDIQERCCEIVGALEEEMQLRQLRKDSRTRIGAIGSGVSGLAVGMLKAGAINAASGVITGTSVTSPDSMSYIARRRATDSVSVFQPPQKRIFFPSGENLRTQLHGDLYSERN